MTGMPARSAISSPAQMPPKGSNSTTPVLRMDSTVAGGSVCVLSLPVVGGAVSDVVHCPIAFCTHPAARSSNALHLAAA